MAPTWLLAQGISNTLDLAAAYDAEVEVRVASSAVTQHEQDMAVRAWLQCRRRAPALTKQMLIACSAHVFFINDSLPT